MAFKPLILCVDDEPRALELRTMVLEQAGYAVLATTEPDRALDLLANNTVSLVILDHLLPGMPGTELARLIKALRPHLPIILLSGIVEEPEEMTNVDLFISKTDAPEQVLSKIATLIASTSTGSASSR